jgi:hypothetical protein
VAEATRAVRMTPRAAQQTLQAAALALAAALAACPKPSAVADAGVAVDDVTFAVPANIDRVAAVVARLPKRGGACAQVKSIKDRAEAQAVADAIAKATAQPVFLVEKDLGARGVWHRICVGAEESGARLIARATRWVAPGGVLEPFLDPPTGNEPRFFVLDRPTVDERVPTPAQAQALLARSPLTAPIFPVGAGLFATTGPARAAAGAGSGATRVVVVDAAGHLWPLDPAPPPGCASCAVAEQKSPVTSRRVVGTGDVFGDSNGAADDLLVEEETADGTRLLAVVAAESAAADGGGATGKLVRQGAVLLAGASTGVILRGEAFVVEADGDDGKEVAISRLELRTALDDAGAAHLCALVGRAELWATAKDSARGLAKLDVQALAATGEAAVVDAVTAFDAAGDRVAASRACARVLGDRPSTLVTQLCLGRVRSLVADRFVVDAVNAAGALAEGSPALRGAVAGPFYAAMSALESDPRLTAAPWDCKTEPLVKDIAKQSIDDVIKAARVKQAERISLADVDDAVFVTATRDFGPDTPVGQIAARWLERLRLAQPARHAAIEAALLPPTEAPTPTESPSSTPTPMDGGPGFGGQP